MPTARSPVFGRTPTLEGLRLIHRGKVRDTDALPPPKARPEKPAELEIRIF